MTTPLPGADMRFEDWLAWRDRAVEEAWEIAGNDGDASADPIDAFDIADLQHWLDLCA